eukprot:m.48544 g.48544  ORF g.48544 m.48544 type:complete len:157 (+) comp13293_c0_seq2:57-527(+)
MPRLNIAYRNLAAIPQGLAQKFGEKCSELDASNNELTKLASLKGFVAIETLILDKNKLTSHITFQHHPRLRTLWINHNQIENLAVFINTLKRSFPELRILSMMNNPAAPSYFNGGSKSENDEYRAYVISQLPALLQLDDIKITDEERAKAKAMTAR